MKTKEQLLKELKELGYATIAIAYMQCEEDDKAYLYIDDNINELIHSISDPTYDYELTEFIDGSFLYIHEVDGSDWLTLDKFNELDEELNKMVLMYKRTPKGRC